jgi:hypothetical protein
VCAFAVKGEWLASNNQINKFSGTVNDGDVKTVCGTQQYKKLTYEQNLLQVVGSLL